MSQSSDYSCFLVSDRVWPGLLPLIDAAERFSRRLKPGQWYRLGVKGVRWSEGGSPPKQDNLGELEITPDGVKFSDIEPNEIRRDPWPAT